MQTIIHGKPHLIIRPLETADLPKLKTFCETCKDLGIINNSDFKNLKLDRMHLPYGQFFIGYDLEKDIIWNIAGVHHLPEIGPNAWRCLFRGAQLPTYTPHWSMNIFKSGVHFSYFLYLQIEVIQQIDPNAEFYISTNIRNSSGAKSARMNEIMMPRLEKQGYWNLTHNEIDLFNTKQNLWRVNVDHYLEQRNLHFNYELSSIVLL
jgi:hypothetical protein